MKIITGMHRSGTSMAANLVRELGGDLGREEDLLEADEWNKRGYFENREIFILNDHILLGSHIPTRKFWTTRPEDRSIPLRLIMTFARAQYLLMLPFKRPLTRRAHAKADEIRKREELYGHLYTKDPRFSLLIGEWANIVPIEKVLYVYRHPFEVANSLQKRGKSPMWVGYLLWNFHVERFLTEVEGQPLIVLNHNNFFDADKRLDEIRRLYNFMERPFDEAEAQSMLKRILDDKLKNFDYAGEKIPESTNKLYARLERYHQNYGNLRAAESFHYD